MQSSSGDSGGAGSRDTYISEVADDILQKLSK
jgi:hypothetical protein